MVEHPRSAGLVRVRTGDQGDEALDELVAREHALPVPSRPQWVLTVPWPRRWLFARNHDLVRGVLREAIAELQDFYAERCGGGRTGTVTVVQRFGSDLRLNVHFHILAVDGTYARDDDGLRWRPLPGPTTADVEVLVDRIARRSEDFLASAGFGPDEETPDDDDTDALIHAASIRGQSAFERRRTQRIAGREIPLPPLCAAFEGYTLHAGVSVGAKQRTALERLCRYVLRPPLARGRLVPLPDGRVAYQLERPFADGSTERVFTREELVQRLVAIIPRPYTNQVLYHGFPASQAKLRPDVVPRRPRRRPARRLAKADDRARSPRTLAWSELLRRVFDADGFRCPGCGGRLQLRAVITVPAVAGKILRDLARGGAGPP